MATSGSIVTNGYQGSSVYRRARLSWTSTSSGTTSTINWTFSLENSDGSTSVSYVTSQAYFDISLAKGTLSDGSTSRRVSVLAYDTSRSKSPGVIGTGSFTITHDSQANARMTLTPRVSIYNWDATGSAQYYGTGTFDLPQLYGQLGSPSGFAYIFSSGNDYLKLEGDSIQFGWFPPKDSSNNSVTGYDIYIKCSSDGGAPTTSDYTYTTYIAKSALPALSSNGAQWVTVSLGTGISKATRGQKVRTAIRARGSAGAAYYSPLAVSGVTRYINRLPDAPAGSDITILSTQTNTTLDVTAGNSNDSGQRSTVYYTSSSTKPASTSAATQHMDSRTYNPGIYYFWSYDGLEFSGSSLQITVSKNTKPTLSLTCEAISGVSKRMNNSTSHLYTPSIKLTPQTNKASNYSITYWVYGFTGWASTPSWPSEFWSKGEFLGTVTSQSTATFSILPKLGHNMSYVITGRVWDGLEYSDTVAIVKVNNKYLTTAPWPTKIAAYNQHSNSQVDGTGTYFYNKIRFVLDYDSEILKGNYCYAKCTTEEVSLNASLSAEDTSQMYADITIAPTLTQNKSYSFTAQLGDGSGNTNSYEASFIQVPLYLGTITSNSSVWYPYTQENDAIFSMSKMALAQEKYILADNWLSIVLSSGSRTFEFATEAEISGGINDAFSISQPPEKLLEILSSLVPKDGSYSLDYYATVTNKFGVVTRVARSTSSQNLTVNFNAAPSLDFTSADILNVNQEGITSSLIGYICEGLNLAFVPSVSVYNGSSSTISIDIARSNSGLINGGLPSGLSWTQFCSFTIRHEEITPSYQTPAQIEISSTPRISIGELSSTETYCYFRARLKNGNNSEIVKTISNVSYKRVRHIPATIALAGAQYDSTNGAEKIDIQYGCSDLGCQSSSSDSNIALDCAISLQYSTGELGEDSSQIKWVEGTEDLPSFVTGMQASLSHKFDSADNFQKIRIKAVTYITTTFATGAKITNSKTSYSNEFLVYNQNPTVALRQNYIGINRRNLPSNSVVAIGSSTGRPKIFLLGVSETRYIDIETGEMDGFILDGGTW